MSNADLERWSKVQQRLKAEVGDDIYSSWFARMDLEALEGDTVDLCASRTCLGTWDRTDFSYMRPLEHITPEQRQARADAAAVARHPDGPGANGGQ